MGVQRMAATKWENQKTKFKPSSDKHIRRIYLKKSVARYAGVGRVADLRKNKRQNCIILSEIEMKQIISIVVCALLLFPSLALAGNKDNSTYVRLSGMVAVAEDSTLESGGVKAGLELDTGFGLSVASGKKFGNGWRAELEYSYRKNDIGDLTLGNLILPTSRLDEKTNTHIIMSNLVYDIQNNTMITPYLGAGIGIGWEEEAEGTEFAYQFLAGISYEVHSRNELIFGYRYTGMTDLDYKIDYTGSKYTATATADSHNF